MPDKSFDVPKGIECPRCKQLFDTAQSVMPEGGRGFKKGLVLVCSNCALPSMVGDSSLIPLSRKMIEGFPKLLQQQLLATCGVIAMEATKKN